MRRRLLNIASTVCLVLCVALMGMWARSYCARDVFRSRSMGERVFSLVSERGQVRLNESVQYSGPIGPIPPFDSSWDVARQGYWDVCGVQAMFSWTAIGVVLPYWLIGLASGALAMALRMRWPIQFTLRSLFIATTFLAIVLGMIAWLDRAWIGK
jgi:hypothetical protein